MGYFSLKMSKDPPLRSMASVTVPCSANFCFQKLKKIIWTTFGFNRMGPLRHTANVTIALLRTVFKNRIISWNSDVDWPPRSYDLTPLDYFFWVAVNDKCYANQPETIEALKFEIGVVIHGTEAQRIENVLKNWVDRMGYCKTSHGSHLYDVVLHSLMGRFNLSNKTILFKK